VRDAQAIRALREDSEQRVLDREALDANVVGLDSHRRVRTLEARATAVDAKAEQ